MAPTASYGAYKRVDIETASQGKLIVMLFNGAIQRAEEARRRMEKDDLLGVHKNLVRSQEIIAELRSALNMNAGEIAVNLDRIYEYLHHLLVKANIRKDPKPIEECVRFMTDLRNTWEDLFSTLAKEDGPKPQPRSNPHGAQVMNLKG